jgi:hypothetical protein
MYLEMDQKAACNRDRPKLKHLTMASTRNVVLEVAKLGPTANSESLADAAMRCLRLRHLQSCGSDSVKHPDKLGLLLFGSKLKRLNSI